MTLSLSSLGPLVQQLPAPISLNTLPCLWGTPLQPHLQELQVGAEAGCLPQFEPNLCVGVQAKCHR